MSSEGESKPQSKGKEEDLDDIRASLRKLTFATLDRLEHDTAMNYINAKEVRLLGGTALRSMRLWLKALDATTKKSRKTAVTQNKE